MMRKLVLASCLALGLTFGLAGSNTAKADHGFGGYRSPASCYPGYGHGGYRVGYVPYGRYYAAPIVAVPAFVPVTSFGRSSFYGHGSAFNPGFGGGFGNLGYPSAFGPRTIPRAHLRIGF